jgi:hypothetical protein
VSGPVAVKRDIAVGADGRGWLKAGHQAGGAGCECGVGVDAAAIGGKLGHLGTADERALLAAVSLHGNSYRFYYGSLRVGPQLHLEIDADAIVGVQHHAFGLY